MTLQSRIIRCLGQTTHRLGLEAVDPSNMSHVEISSSDDGGFYLYRFDQNNVCLADTFHSTLGEAKEQAGFEFELEKDGWQAKSLLQDEEGNS